jgi:septum formation protein
MPAIHRLGADSIPVDGSGKGELRRATESRLETTPKAALGLHPRFSTRLFFLALILASTSAIRLAMLDAAGVAVEAVAPGVDEAALKGGANPEATALLLAEAKARAVSAARPGEWTIGADSLVSVGGRTFDKPRDRAEAAEHLRFFSGKPLRLISAVALALDGRVDWSVADEAVFRVRELSESFIDSYLAAEWPEVAYCVGVFRMEGRGVQLFSAIHGSHFTILGMPLLPLLDALRERRLMPS